MLGARACSPHTAIHHLGARASSPPPAICHVGAQASSPHAGSAGFQPASAICPAWVRGRPARMPGARASRPHTAIRPITSAPPGDAGFQPAYGDTPHHPCTVWVRGLPARIRRYTPSPLHRLGTRASRPHAGGRRRCACFFSPGCASVAPACRERGRLTCFFSPGSAGVSPACRIRERLARMPGARAFRPHAAMRPIRGRDALIPRRVCSPRCEQLHNPVLLFHCRDRAILRSDPGRKNAHCCPNDHE
jgi:hypothetical protein